MKKKPSEGFEIGRKNGLVILNKALAEAEYAEAVLTHATKKTRVLLRELRKAIRQAKSTKCHWIETTTQVSVDSPNHVTAET